MIFARLLKNLGGTEFGTAKIRNLDLELVAKDLAYAECPVVPDNVWS